MFSPELGDEVSNINVSAAANSSRAFVDSSKKMTMLIRPPIAPPRIIAAFAWWFIVTLGDATWCSFGFFPPSTVIPLMIGTLPALVIASPIELGSIPFVN